jgi:hypothetical protein
VAEKVLRSAVSNLQNKDEGGRLDPDEIVVKRASVDGGMTMKRISPAPMGRAFRIRKRSNHVTIVVAAKDKKEKKDAKQARQVKKAGKPAKESKAGKSGAKQKSAADTK